MQKAKNLILYGGVLVIGLYFLFQSLIVSQTLLAPVFISMLAAMLVLPVNRHLEKKMNRFFSSFISTLMIFIAYMGLLFLVGYQTNKFSDQWPETREKLAPKVEELTTSIAENTGVTEAQIKKQVPSFFYTGEQEQDKQEQSSSGNSTQFKTARAVLVALADFLTKNVLVFVYIFFLLLYRQKFKNAILAFVPDKNQDVASDIVSNSVRMAQKYLVGKFIIIVMLAAFYAIGLTIVGIDNAVLIAIIAALLTLIPYLGNVIGGALALFAGFLSGGDILTNSIGVLVVFGVSQLFENNVLQPYIVGKEVELNPLITIIGVVAGSTIWGLAGSVIAIPYLGILKVICDRIDVLKPMGNFLGDEKESSSGFAMWMKSLFH
jgi:predicted PurR-regulated permease PerM